MLGSMSAELIATLAVGVAIGGLVLGGQRSLRQDIAEVHNDFLELRERMAHLDGHAPGRPPRWTPRGYRHAPSGAMGLRPCVATRSVGLPLLQTLVSTKPARGADGLDCRSLSRDRRREARSTGR